MHISLAGETLDRLANANVYFSLTGEPRLQPGDVLQFNDDLRIEPFSAFLAGNTLASLGSFSYSWSPLFPGISIGRYCSISWNLQIVAGNHPTAFVSTSSFTYDPDFAIFAKALADRPFNRFASPVSAPEPE